MRNLSRIYFAFSSVAGIEKQNETAIRWFGNSTKLI